VFAGTLVLVSLTSCASTAAVPAGPTAAADPVTIRPAAETAPVGHSGDAADDPAIWVHPNRPSESLVLGNDKLGALEVYALDGTLVQRIDGDGSPWGNVDVRGDLVVAWNGDGARMFAVDPGTGRLTEITDPDATATASGAEGLCLYQAPDALYAFVVVRTGDVVQFRLADSDGDDLLEGRQVRRLEVGSEAEGCAADDETGDLYVSEEDVALWRYDAAPDAGTSRVAVDRTTADGGHLVPDVEGVAVTGDVVLVSAQNTDPAQSYIAVYERSTGSYVASLRVGDGDAADDCDGTDGITAYAGDLGPSFPHGLLVCQDGSNEAPGAAGNQDFKLVPFEQVPEP
jgi:myo-inositol-hexaphosphate 3-phosphohydrolase